MKLRITDLVPHDSELVIDPLYAQVCLVRKAVAA